MPLQKVKRGSHFGVLTGMWIFQHNLTQGSQLLKAQVKIRFAFHFVERNNLVLYTVSFHFGHFCLWDQSAVYILC